MVMGAQQCDIQGGCDVAQAAYTHAVEEWPYSCHNKSSLRSGFFCALNQVSNGLFTSAGHCCAIASCTPVCVLQQLRASSIQQCVLRHSATLCHGDRTLDEV